MTSIIEKAIKETHDHVIKQDDVVSVKTVVTTITGNQTIITTHVRTGEHFVEEISP